jgi:hypothetical protein
VLRPAPHEHGVEQEGDEHGRHGGEHDAEHDGYHAQGRLGAFIAALLLLLLR